MVPMLAGIAGLLLGFGAGFLYRKSIAAGNAQSIEARAQKLLLDAELEAAAASTRAVGEAKEEIALLRREADGDLRSRRDEIGRQESRMKGAEADLKAKIEGVVGRSAELQEREEKLTYVRTQLEKATDLHRAQLEKIASMTSSEARAHLMAQILDDAKRAAMSQVRELEQQAREEGEERARKIVTIAIQRVASEQTAESTVSVFALPTEDMKGRIIGREGRNIRAFESVTGVNLIIDDTPEAVVLSCFDPVRREAARMTLAKLVEDGRIHPARIEEIHERSQRELEERVRRAGEDAVAEVLPAIEGRRDGQVADPHPRREQGLAVGVRHDRVRVDLGRAMERPTVEEDPVVGLVGDEVNPPADPVAGTAQRRRQRLEVGRRVDPAARVVGRVQQDGARPGRDRGIDRGQVEVERRRRQRDPDRDAARGEDQDLVEEPRRREEDHLVARLQDRPERDCERGKPAVRHGHVCRIPVETGPRRERAGHRPL